MPFPNALHNPDLHLQHHVQIVFLWHPFSLEAHPRRQRSASATRLERNGTRAALNPNGRWQQPKKADPVGFTTTLPLSCAAALALEAAVV